MWSSQWTWPPFTSSFKHPKLVSDVYANVFRKWGILKPKHTQIGGGFGASKSLTRPDGFSVNDPWRYTHLPYECQEFGIQFCKNTVHLYKTEWVCVCPKHVPKMVESMYVEVVFHCISVSSLYGSKKPGWTATPPVLFWSITLRSLSMFYVQQVVLNVQHLATSIFGWMQKHESSHILLCPQRIFAYVSVFVALHSLLCWI